MRLYELLDRTNTKPFYDVAYKHSMQVLNEYFGTGDIHNRNILSCSRLLSDKLENAFRKIVKNIDLNSYFTINFSDEFSIMLTIFTHKADEMGNMEYSTNKLSIELYVDKQHFIDIIKGEGDVEQISNLLAQMFSHEVLHFIQINKRPLDQEKEMYGFDKSLSNTGNERTDYFGQPIEIEAYANNAAHQLLFAYDRDLETILSKLRTQDGIKDAIQYSNTMKEYYNSLRNNPAAGETWKKFLKTVYRVIKDYTE